MVEESDIAPSDSLNHAENQVSLPQLLTYLDCIQICLFMDFQMSFVKYISSDHFGLRNPLDYSNPSLFEARSLLEDAHRVIYRWFVVSSI